MRARHATVRHRHVEWQVMHVRARDGLRREAQRRAPAASARLGAKGGGGNVCTASFAFDHVTATDPSRKAPGRWTLVPPAHKNKPPTKRKGAVDTAPFTTGWLGRNELV